MAKAILPLAWGFSSGPLSINDVHPCNRNAATARPLKTFFKLFISPPLLIWFGAKIPAPAKRGSVKKQILRFYTDKYLFLENFTGKKFTRPTPEQGGLAT